MANINEHNNPLPDMLRCPGQPRATIVRIRKSLAISQFRLNR